MSPKMLISRCMSIVAILTTFTCCLEAQILSSRGQTPKTSLRDGATSSQMQRLRSQDPEIVGNACSILGESRVKRAVPEIQSVITESESPDVQAKCAFALGRIGSTEALALLRTLATDLKRNDRVRVAAIHATSLIEGVDPSYLISLLGDSDANVRAAAAYELCQLHSNEAVAIIRSMLGSSDSSIRRAALTAASIWPEEFSSELAKLSARAGGSPEEKITALTALDSSSPDKLSRKELENVATLLEKNQQPEIVDAAEQLLNKSSVGRTIASERNIKAQSIDGRAPDETRLGGQTVHPDADLIVSVTTNNRRIVPGYLGLVLGFAALMPLLIATVQGAPLARLPNVTTEGSISEIFGNAPRQMERPDRMLYAAACLALSYVAVWFCPFLIWSGVSVLPSQWASALETVGMGAAGAYVWTIAIILARASRDDLRASLFWSGISGVAFAVFVSALIASSPIRSQRLEDAIALLCGLFAPLLIRQAFERLTTLVAHSMHSKGNKFPEPDGYLEQISGIGTRQRLRLDEAKIETVQQLATADFPDLTARTPFSPATLIDWIDQAIALNHFPVHATTLLRNAGLKVSALELSLAAPEAGAPLDRAAAIAGILHLPTDLISDRLNLLYHDPQLRQLVQVSDRTDKARWLTAPK
jgi:hypothetical protein